MGSPAAPAAGEDKADKLVLANGPICKGGAGGLQGAGRGSIFATTCCSASVLLSYLSRWRRPKLSANMQADIPPTTANPPRCPSCGLAALAGSSSSQLSDNILPKSCGHAAKRSQACENPCDTSHNIFEFLLWHTMTLTYSERQELVCGCKRLLFRGVAAVVLAELADSKPPGLRPGRLPLHRCSAFCLHLCWRITEHCSMHFSRCYSFS